MSKKSAKIAALIEQCRGHELAAQYLGYFECFNRQLFYEAHDVLEELWLAEGRNAANYGFYKGLIQFAGAFVHLQKKRRGPAVALFKLSRSYLSIFITASAVGCATCLDPGGRMDRNGGRSGFTRRGVE